MNDLKSKLPDLKELTSMTSKLFNDLKNSVTEIIQDYKQKRAEDDMVTKPDEPPVEKPATPPENPNDTVIKSGNKE